MNFSGNTGYGKTPPGNIPPSGHDMVEQVIMWGYGSEDSLDRADSLFIAPFS